MLSNRVYHVHLGSGPRLLTMDCYLVLASVRATSEVAVPAAYSR